MNRHGIWAKVLLITLGFCVGSTKAAAPAAPIVPGYAQLLHAPKPDLATSGRLLLGELNCTACHAAGPAVAVVLKGAPDLNQAGARLTPQFIRAFLSDPHGVKPGTTMPDLLHGLDDSGQKHDVEALTHFLISLGGPMPPPADVIEEAEMGAGDKLFHTVGCVACHAPEKSLQTQIPSVPLGPLAMKMTIAALSDFLLNPLKARPASRMPNLGLSRIEAHEIAAYLLRDQKDNPQSAHVALVSAPGLNYRYFAHKPADCKMETFAAMTPSSQGYVPQFTLDFSGHAENDFAVQFAGSITIPRDGKYTFYTRSDDGSRLFIDDHEVVNNDGVHPAEEHSGNVSLKAGKHAIVVNFFQGGGGYELAISIRGPHVAKEEIPTSMLTAAGVRPAVPLQSENFVVDPQKAKEGQALFQSIGCAACHSVQNLKPGKSFKALLAMDIAAAGGCLSAQPANDAPQFDFSAGQRTAIAMALADKTALAMPFTVQQRITHDLAAMNCYACHNRDGVGGPAPDRADFFTMSAPFDMGDEGRLPPRLTGVGGKLTQDAITQIVFEGKLHVRPELATRMPIFSRERLAELPAALEQCDAAQPDAPPPVSLAASNDGRRLIGTKGLGCVNCHGVDEVKSLGMPAPNLSTEHLRLRYDWLSKLLANPAKVNPGTRMPAFWDQGDVVFKDIAGGTMNGQIAAIWAYLSLGESMPLPAGLQSSNQYELIPTDQPIVHRTYVAPGLFYPGKIGTRAILVGFPAGIHCAFDAGTVRLAFAWRGRFFDAGGQWIGRGGRALGPLGTNILQMPAGPAFAVLADPNAHWPTIDADHREVGGQFKGYVLDKSESPAFHYILDNVLIEEQPLPDVSGPATLVRKFHLTAQQPVAGLYFLAGAGAKIEAISPNAWRVDEQYTVTLKADMKPVIRTDGQIKQLVVPVSFQNNAADLEARITW